MRIPLPAYLVLFAAATCWSGEKPAAPTTPTEDPITAAKRDFDAVKAERDTAGMSKSDAPAIGLPTLQLTPTEPRLPTTSKSLGLEKKSANWLVDAMQKRSDGRREQSGRRDADRDAAPGIEADEEMNSSKLTAESKTGRLRGDGDSTLDRERKELDPTLNPLTKYLAGWMTPQDYALLKPGLQGVRSGDSAPGTGTSVSPFAGELSGIVAPEVAIGLAGTNKPAFVPATPHENPYLQAFNGPTSMPSPPAAPVAPPTSIRSQVPAISTPSGLPAPPVQAKIPDFVKPSTDEKYFKPLKRF